MQILVLNNFFYICALQIQLYRLYDYYLSVLFADKTASIYTFRNINFPTPMPYIYLDYMICTFFLFPLQVSM